MRTHRLVVSLTPGRREWCHRLVMCLYSRSGPRDEDSPLRYVFNLSEPGMLTLRLVMSLDASQGPGMRTLRLVMSLLHSGPGMRTLRLVMSLLSQDQG